MTTPLTIACLLPQSRRGYGQRRRERAHRVQPRSTLAPGRIPRISRLMALAWRLDELVRTGVVADYAELARLGHVSRARISQILNLLALAPDIQESLLFLGFRQPMQPLSQEVEDLLVPEPFSSPEVNFPSTGLEQDHMATVLQ